MWAGGLLAPRFDVKRSGPLLADGMKERVSISFGCIEVAAGRTGLVAAIPAVVIYNHYSREASGYRVLMGDPSAEVLRLLSRDLDRRDAVRAARAQGGGVSRNGCEAAEHRER